MEGGQNLNNFVVGSVPTVFYIPDFINDAEQDQLLNNINQAPISKWKSMKNRRLQNWGGVVHEKGLLPQDLPPWLRRITERINKESSLFPSAINHVLINEYLPNQGIMPHQDGPAYFPVVAILSLGSPVVMDFTPHPSLRLCMNTVDENKNGESSDSREEEWLDGHHPFSVLLMPQSLLIFKDKAYTDYLHGIKDDAGHKYSEAVNAIQCTRHLDVNHSLPESEKIYDLQSTGDISTLRRLQKRVSLTCRVVSKDSTASDDCEGSRLEKM